jgi:putative aldouronate transport system substrate-binding protein
MRRIRKSLLTGVVVGLIMVMATGVAFGQDHFAKHLEIEWLGWTMRFHDEDKASENIYLNEMSERFNTTFIWPDLRDWSNTEAVAAQLATGRIPEFAAVLQANMDELYQDDMIRTWSFEDIREKMPNTAQLMDETGAWSFLRVPGEDALMGIPQLFRTPLTMMVSYYRLDWLENLGIEPPGELVEIAPRVFWSTEGFDTEQMRQILKRFVDENASGAERTYGLGSYFPATFTSFGQAGALYGTEGRGVDINVFEDGEMKFIYATNAYRDALMWFNQLYQEGVLSKETVIEAQDTAAARDLWNSGHLGYMQYHYSYIYEAADTEVPFAMLQANPDAKVLVVPTEMNHMTGLYGTSAGGAVMSSAIPTGFKIGTLGRAALASSDLSDEKFDRAMRIFDWLHSTREGALRNWWGVEGVNFDWSGEPWKSPLIYHEVGPEHATNLLGGYWLPWLYEVRKLGTPYETVENDLLAKAGYMDHYVHQYRYDFLNETDIITMRKRYDSGLTTTALEYTANFILGDIDIDEGWDDYLADLERNGMSRYLEEYENAPLVDAYLDGRLEY